MKTIEVKVYVADDGTRFESEEKCIDHEFDCKLRKIVERISFQPPVDSSSLEAWFKMNQHDIEKLFVKKQPVVRGVRVRKPVPQV